MINKRGAALITALLVIAIVSVIAMTLLNQTQIDIRRSELNFNADSAYLAAEGVKDWAIVEYDTVYVKSPQNVLAPHWPIVMQTEPLPGGKIEGYLQNAQGRFNLNNLQNSAYQIIFANLINYVDPTISHDQAMQLATHVTTWLTPVNQAGTTDPVYQRMSPPYRPAHAPMISSSELRLVDGFTADLYHRLEPYIIALPDTTTIDVNAASEAVLVAGGLSINGAQEVLSYLKNQPNFTDLSTFANVAQFQPASGSNATPIFDVKSNYFYAQANIHLGKVYFIAYYLLQYNQELHSLQIIRYSQGTL